jgi:hypothetical protein
MFEYFYHEILRKTVIGFGTLFNDISIKHTNSSGEVVSVVEVPLAYGPTQKFLARLEQSPNLNKTVQMTLPRMSFEFIGLNYDPTRKVTSTQTFLTSLSSDRSESRKAYMPVPYNMQFELSIMTKLNDDMLQIVEQILPYFQPSYNLTINLVDDITEKRDVPIVLDGITMSDDYEGDYSTRRALIYTLRFTAKIYLFGPVSSVTNDIVKKVTIGYVAGSSDARSLKTRERDVSYSVEPRATKSYTHTVVTTLAEDIDNLVKSFTLNDASSISSGDYIMIGSEEMKVSSKSADTITVERSTDGSTLSNHVLGSDVKLITDADNAQIEIGDDFGFSGGFE